MDNKRLSLILAVAFISPMFSNWVSNTFRAPEDTAAMQSDIRHLREDVLELTGRVDRLLDSAPTMRDMKSIDDRFKSENARRLLVEERLYKANVEAKEAIADNSTAIKEILNEIRTIKQWSRP